MQVRPEHATALFAHVVQGFVAGFVGAAQVQGYVDQSVLGGNVRVDGEERVMAGVAAAEGAGGGAWKGWIGDLFLAHGNSPDQGGRSIRYHTKWVAAARGVVNRTNPKPGRLESLTRTAAMAAIQNSHIRVTTPDRQVIRRRFKPKGRGSH